MIEREKLIEIRHLSTAFRTEDRSEVQILKNVSFDVYKGECFGVVGESGSGKSVTAKSIMRLLPSPPAKVLNGEILYRGENVLEFSEKRMRDIRGNKISMIFQEPMTALNPVFTCGEQVIESIVLHRKTSRAKAMDITLEMFKKVGIPNPETRVRCYPHELSGGMRQRIIIAMALCCNPELLIADEPTTALDTTVQAQVLDLIRDLQKEMNMTVYYITHDLAVVAELCDRVAVMYGGQIMETGTVQQIFKNPRHPYTYGLMLAMPKIDEKRERLYNIQGNVPSFFNMPKGCPFATRCEAALPHCMEHAPEEVEIEVGHSVRCWRAMEEMPGKKVCR